MNNPTRNHWKTRITTQASFALLAIACGGNDEADTGTLSVLLESEDLIADGLKAGEEIENIRDGWSVTFDKYIATIGDIDLHLSTDQDVEVEAEEVFVFDLTKLPSSGLPLWEVSGLQEGRWEFHYSTPGAGDGSTRHKSVSRDDYEEMVEHDWTYLIDGMLMMEGGESCPPATLAEPGDKEPNGNTSGGNDCYDAEAIRFVLGAAAETVFGPCKIDTVAGVAISAGTTKTAAVTIHGDHLFFNGFPTGDEGGTIRLAQWWADSDLNLDGTVTQDELEQIHPSELPEIDDRYSTGANPLKTDEDKALENMYDYVRAQLMTQGHFEGEGECPVNGVEHDHGHEDVDEHED